MIIEFKDGRQYNGIQGIIPFELADELELDLNDEINFKLVGGLLYMYRVDPYSATFGSGFKMSKNGSNKGYSIYSNKLNTYITGGEKFNVDTDYEWDDLNGIELFLMEKI